MTAVPLLSVRGLSKRFGGVRALDGVDFELGAGEVMALLGENGAGKSTFVKILSGLVSPDEGEIRMLGEPVALRTSQRAQEAGVAVVQQEYSAVPNLTVAENIYLGQAGAPLIWRRRALATSASPLLEQVGLAGLDPLTELRRLSVAERQLVEVARVLARDARVVIFDEPTAALSDAEITRVLDVVRGLAAAGRGVIYVTHRLREVYDVADRVTVFRDGRNLPTQRVNDTPVDDVVAMMLGRRLTQLFPAREGEPGPVRLRIEALTATGLAEPVSFEVRAGEIVGLTGQMGSGAGLTLRALAAEEPITSGSVSLDGVDITRQTRREGIATGIAYCSADRQRDGLFAVMPVQRNLTSPWLADVSSRGVVRRRPEREAAWKAATRMLIDARRLGARADTLSGGNQQKVAVGRWMAGEISVLLVEEPTRGVDVGARAELYQQLTMLCRSGLAVVIASSDTSEIFGLCHTIGTFYRGALTRVAAHDQWSEESLLREVMHGSVAA